MHLVNFTMMVVVAVVTERGGVLAAGFKLRLPSR